MKASLVRFALLFGTCAVLSIVVTLFNGRSMAAFVNLGSYVWLLCLLLGCWRLLNGSNNAVEQAHMTQRVQNFEASLQGKKPPHTAIVPMFLSSGAMVFSGVSWLALLQIVRYGWHIQLG